MTIYRRLLIAVAFFLLCFSLPIFAQAPTRITKILSTTACPGAGCVLLDVSGLGSAGFQVAGTFVATVQIEGSIDNITYVSVACLPNGGSATVTSLTATGVWTCPTAGLRSLRWRVSAFTSGTATVTAQAIVAVARSLFPLIAPSATVQALSSTSTVYLENPLFTNTAGCPVCGFPLSAYARISAYDNTAGGLQIGSMANGFANPAMRFIAIGGQWTGIGNPITAPIVQFSVASGNAGGGILGSVGYLYEFTNSISGAPDLSRWCRTTEAAVASCTTDYGGGTPDRYLFDFAQTSNDLFRIARLSFGASKTTASAPADGQLNLLNQAETSGVGFDVSTDGTLKVRNRAQNANGNLQFAAAIQSGKTTTYNNVATAGYGLPAIYGENISSTQTANFTALTQSPAANAGRWECSDVLTTTSATNTGTLQVTLDYVDSQGTTHTADILPIAGAAGTFAASQTSVASKEFYTAPKRITVNNANTSIVLKVVITGSVSYTVSPRCWQEA